MDIAIDAVNDAVKHHETLWLSDGNIILATNTYLFRVHKSVLAMHSSVFEDMFAFPAADDSNISANETVGIVPDLHGGLPVVSLTDEGKEVEHLLKAVYEPQYYDMHQDHHTFDKVEALLKLSFKYNFHAIRSNVVEHFSRIYPTSLSEYEAIRESHAMRIKHHKKKETRVLRAAIEAGIDELYPALYYTFARVPFAKLRKLVPDTPAGWNALDCIVAGREDLNRIGLRIMSRIMELTEQCVLHHHKEGCTHDFDWEFDNHELFQSVDLGNFSGSHLVNEFEDRICDSCRSSIEEAIEEERRDVWHEIPEYFGMKSWFDARRKLKTWNENNS